MASNRVGRSFAVTLGAALAAAGVATPAGAAPGCERRGLEEVQRSPSGKIAIVHDGNYEGHELYMACWRPTRKLQPMVSDWLFLGRQRVTAVGGLNFRGPWVTWAQASVDGTETDWMYSLNVRTGERGPMVAADPHARAAEDRGPIQHTDGALSRKVAISRSGMYAWLVRGVRTPGGRRVDALYAPHDGFAQRLDVGGVGSIDRLFFRGDDLVWVRDGQVRRVALDPGTSETPADDDPCRPTLPNGSWPPAEQPSSGWHGHGGIWTGLAPDGVLRFTTRYSSIEDPAPKGEPGIHADGSATTKMLWIGSRTARRTLRIRGRLIDGPALQLRARSRSVAENGRPRVWPSYVTFPAAGCWRVTATSGDARLTFRIRVAIPGQ
jgi:hypothetical protein